VLLPGLLPGEPRKNMSGEPKKALQRLDPEAGVAVGDAKAPPPTAPSVVTLLADELLAEAGCPGLILGGVVTGFDGKLTAGGLLGLLRRGVTGIEDTDKSMSSLHSLTVF